MFNIDDIVTLEDGVRYYLIDRYEVDGRFYFYSVEYDDNLDKMLDNEYCFLLVDGDYLSKVNDGKLRASLISLFMDRRVLNYNKE